MEINTHEKYSAVIREFVKLMKTQKAAAKKLSVSTQAFNYWYNYAKNIPLQQINIMKMLLLKNKNPEQCLLSKIFKNSEIPERKLMISERVKLAMQFEKELGQRRGRPALHDKNQKENSLNLDCFQGKTIQLAAEKYELGNKDTYRYAKKVVLSGLGELINAMDKKHLSPSLAAKLSDLSPIIISELLSKNKNTIIAYLENLEQSHNKITKKFGNLELFNDSQLLKIEKEIQLPLRIIFLGLISCCNEQGEFNWCPQQLKSHILPYIDIDFSKLLDVLFQYGLIQKNKVNQDYYGKIPKIKAYIHEVRDEK